MTNSLPRTACMSAKACQRRVSAGMASTLAPRSRRPAITGAAQPAARRAPSCRDHVAVLDLLAAGDEDVADDRRREQAVLDDAGDPGRAGRPARAGRRRRRGSRRSRRCRATEAWRGAPAPRPAAAAWPAGRSSAARAAPGGPSASTTLSDEAMTTKRAEAAATTFSRVCAPPPPLMTQPSGATWSAPSMAMSSASRVSNGSTTSPSSSARCSVAGEVATQRSVRRRCASAGSR